MLQNEIWKSVKDYEGIILVSNFGRVHYLPKIWVSGNGRICKHDGIITYGQTTPKGYKQLSIRIHKKEKKLLVHRLVAQAFIKNKNIDYTQVDHINGNKDDNRAENLRWCNNLLNCNFDNKNSKKRKTSKKVGVIFNSQQKKWQSYIRFNGKNKHLGFFEDENDAIQIRLDAESVYLNKTNSHAS